MSQLFGVTRPDLDALARARYESGATLQPSPVYVPPKGGTAYTSKLFTPGNTQRVQDIVSLAATDPRFVGNYGWYENQPLLDRFIAEHGLEEGTRRWERFHQIGASFSPGSDVSTEIRRASIADLWSQQGQGARFLDLNKDELEDVLGMEGAGHVYHTTAHQMARPLLEGTGPVVFNPKGAPKVGQYYRARLGTQMDVPVGDAHWGRAIGLPDVRTRRATARDPDPWTGSPSANEYYPMQEWFRERVANPIGVPSVPAQALMWNAAGRATGVKTDLGAPFMELVSKAIGRRAEQTGKTPETVRDQWIAGREHLWGLGGLALTGGMFGSDEVDAAVVPHILREMEGAVDLSNAIPKAMDALRKQIAGRDVPVFDRVGDRLIMPEQYRNSLRAMGVDAPGFREVKDPQEFIQRITAAKNSDPTGAAVYVYPQEDYRKMRLFTTEDGTAGFALKDDDIVSVFKHRQSPHSKLAFPMILAAVEQGGKRLDAFDTVLPHLYSQVGFRESSRIPWYEPEAPAGWSKEAFGRFNRGEPDVVFMHQDLGGPAAVVPPGPVQYGQRELAPGYDEAVEIQKRQAEDAWKKVLAGGLLSAPAGVHAGTPNPWAGDIASTLEQVESPFGFFSPSSAAQYMRDLSMGQTSGPGTLVGTALEMVDPVTMGLTLGHIIRRASQ